MTDKRHNALGCLIEIAGLVTLLVVFAYALYNGFFLESILIVLAGFIYIQEVASCIYKV
jgi:accessory gene regulator protein AgrB